MSLKSDSKIRRRPQSWPSRRILLRIKCIFCVFFFIMARAVGFSTRGEIYINKYKINKKTNT
jgi:hypothetical protein